MEIKINSFDRKLIANIIHDRFFYLDELIFNEKEKSLVIPYYSDSHDFYFSDSHALTLEGRIVINNVKEVKIVDKEKIGRYDFNYIEYVKAKNKLIIWTGFPLQFELIIDKLDITISICEKSPD